ncbi:IclR family transcriptional regulator [Arthrobacter sp. I2-34]|uniref:IclR family transcriptional regulator n=1 Tax=Arthrobacter hankyongi TaxID=2904801 RepID=A0ABS9LB44_9MICC|nr:IclR family transcriptional regulator [Arthrobacter hankyongi]MCG2623684.1 IclR family transcriptional regulator [Arthrobacter hankyongi]
MPLSHVEAGDEYTIASLDLGLHALTLLLARDRTTVGELAAMLGTGRSRAHRVLRTLEARGFVAPSASGRGFVAGPAVLRLSAPGGTAVRTRFELRPTIERVRTLTGEDVHTCVLVGDQVLVVDGRRSHRTPSIGLRVGMMVPAHAMAGGKLLLSHLDDGQVLGLMPPSLARHGPNTITDRSSLICELAATRARGFAVASQESERGVDSVAVLLGGGTWRDRIALVVSCPTDRGGPGRLTTLGEQVLAALQEGQR